MTQRTLFGTDGIRGLAGEPPFDDATLRAIGYAVATTLAEIIERPPRLLSGRDTRESGPRIEAAFAAGVREAGGSLDSAGVITTPGVACVTRLEGYDAGIVVSASHNPYHDNGIKIFSPTGQKLADDAEARVEEIVARGPLPVAGDPTAELSEEAGIAGGPSGRTTPPAEPTVTNAHRDRYLAFLRERAAGDLDLAGLKLALDCAHGAAYALAPRLFRSLGAEVHAIGVEPDGRNINEGCGSLHLGPLGALVRETGADLGVAFDGDADRALFVDAYGEPVDGDRILYALAVDLDARGLLAGRRVVATVMSNVGLEIALGERGIALARTPVGDKNVLDELLRGGGSLGGEQSGHMIFPEISLAGDGMITALEVLAAVRRARRPLAELVSGMQPYPQILLNVRVREKRPFESVPEIVAAASQVQRELEGTGRLLLRYSGTENLARVMIEGRDEDEIRAQAGRIADAIRAALGTG
jgi:phosphoglucosamine mutase